MVVQNWFQCIPAIPDFRPLCQEEDIHMSVGARGYYPITDRRYGCVMPVLQLQWFCRETVGPSSMGVTALWTVATTLIIDARLIADTG